MKTFELNYTIKEGCSWRPNSIKIESNLSGDELIECELAESLVKTLKEGSAALEPDKLLLGIAEAQKKEIETNIEQMDELSLTAKVNADKAHQVMLDIFEDGEKKFLELEEKFSTIEKSFKNKISACAESMKKETDKILEIEKILDRVESYKMERLMETLRSLVKIVESDKELVKLVLKHKDGE